MHRGAGNERANLTHSPQSRAPDQVPGNFLNHLALCTSPASAFAARIISISWKWNKRRLFRGLQAREEDIRERKRERERVRDTHPLPISNRLMTLSRQ